MTKTVKGKTKLQINEEKKKELADSIEYLRQVDVPESQGGGRKFVHDKRVEDKKIEDKKQDQAKNYLDSVISARYTYRERIARYGFQRLADLDFPVNWEFYCIPTDGNGIDIFGKQFQTKEGVLVILKSPKGNVYIRGILITLDPEYDINAINILVLQAENTLDSEKGILLSDNVDTAGALKKTKNGIYLPN